MTRLTVRTALFLVLSAATLVGTACADPPERLNEGQDGNDTDLPIGDREDPIEGDGDGDTTEPGDGDGTTEPGDGDSEIPADPVHVLTLVSGAINLITGETTELTLQVVTDEGFAVANAAIDVGLTNAVASLEAATLTTDATGRARVDNTGLSAGTTTFSAQTDYANTLTSSVQVTLPPEGTLSVSLVRQTRIAVTHTDLFVWTGDTVPTCESIEDGSNATAPTATLPVATLPSTKTVSGIAHQSEAAIFAVAYAGDLVLSTACRTGLMVTGGQTTNASLTLNQRDTTLDGDYDVLMHLQLGQALPEPYESYVGTTSAVLSDPAGFAAYHALRALDDDLGTSFIAWDQAAPPYASYDEVSANPGTFGTWALARDYVDAQLAQRLGQPYTNVTTVGGDIRDIVTDFEVGSRFSITQGEAGEVNITERWNALVFEWHLGCDAGDEGCARRAIETDDLQLSATDATYGGLYDLASTQEETERFLVRGNAHSMSFRYGAVVTTAFNQVVFPSLPEGVASDSLGGVLANLIDCNEVGDALADAIGFGTIGMYAGFCDVGIAYAADQIQDQVVALELGNDSPELSPKDQTGAFGGGELVLVDADHNLEAELLREFEWSVSWNDTEDATAAEEIYLPITGEGRLAAARCDGDAMCGAGNSCQPVAHYLKVQQSETDCRPAVGSFGGEQACSSDTQCASGLCVTDSTGSDVCFAACTTGDTCSSGSCGSAGGLLDLDDVLDGLGQGSAMACGFTNQASGVTGMCENTCGWANDGVCDDGGAGSEYSVCGLGTDCGDCGSR